jgi:hypothetical protein
VTTVKRPLNVISECSRQAAENPGRLLRVDRQKSEVDNARRRKLSAPVDQCTEITIEGEEQPLLGSSELKHRGVRGARHVFDHGTDVQARYPQRIDGCAGDVLVREESDHAAPRSTE